MSMIAAAFERERERVEEKGAEIAQLARDQEDRNSKASAALVKLQKLRRHQIARLPAIHYQALEEVRNELAEIEEFLRNAVKSD